MAKEIDMYNVYFGDCFILKDGDSKLLVDFGTHYSSIICKKYTNRVSLLKRVARNIAFRYRKKIRNSVY